jgi:ribonuclease Z
MQSESEGRKQSQAQAPRKDGASEVVASRRDLLKGGASMAGAAAAVAVGGAADPAAAADSPADTVTLKKVIARPDLWFYPGEELDPNEMRVTLMGTGWGNVIRPNQKGASVFVELGNGDSFVFDTGPGCGINYNVMQVPASRMTRIFLTHLHLDHTSDLAWIYAFGPAGDRYTPLQVYGPTGDKPEYGTKANIEGIKVLSQWHRPSFATCIDVGKSYDLEITELDYRLNPGIAYQANGVTIRHFPRLHVIDGAIGYRVDWNGLSMVWTGDGQPSYVTSDNAKGVDLFISETAPSTERFAAATGLPLATAKIIVGDLPRSRRPRGTEGLYLRRRQPLERGISDRRGPDGVQRVQAEDHHPQRRHPSAPLGGQCDPAGIHHAHARRQGLPVGRDLRLGD